MSSSLNSKLTHNISIAILAVYSPILLASLVLCSRRGHGRFLPWMFLCAFAIIRIVGGALQLSTTHMLTSKSLTMYVGARLCAWLGLMPLFLATLFTMGNIFAAMRSPHPKHFLRMTPTVHEIIVSVTMTVSFILGIVGVLNAGDDFKAKGTYTTPNVLASSAIIAIPAFLALLDAVVFMGLRMRHDKEQCPRPLVVVCMVSLPLLAVRLVYQVLEAFSTNSLFYLFDGSSGVFLGMAVVEEMIVAAGLVVGGFLAF